jgi:hypothetical protein
MPRSPHDWGRALADQDAHVAIANVCAARINANICTRELRVRQYGPLLCPRIRRGGYLLSCSRTYSSRLVGLLPMPRSSTLPAYTSGRLLVELLAHVLVTVGGIVTYAPVQLKRLV